MADLKLINQIINSWDPIKLFDCHIPIDEYMCESKKIKQFFDINSPDINDLAKKIYNIFIDSFGSESFSCDIDDCIEIAKNIKKCN